MTNDGENLDLIISHFYIEEDYINNEQIWPLDSKKEPIISDECKTAVKVKPYYFYKKTNFDEWIYISTLYREETIYADEIKQ